MAAGIRETPLNPAESSSAVEDLTKVTSALFASNDVGWKVKRALPDKRALDIMDSNPMLQRLIGQDVNPAYGYDLENWTARKFVTNASDALADSKLSERAGVILSTVEAATTFHKTWKSGATIHEAYGSASIKLLAAIVSGEIGQFAGFAAGTGTATLFAASASPFLTVGLPVIVGIGVAYFGGKVLQAGLEYSMTGFYNLATGKPPPPPPTISLFSVQSAQAAPVNPWPGDTSKGFTTVALEEGSKPKWSYDVTTKQFKWLDKGLEAQYDKLATILGVDPTPVKLWLKGDRFYDKNDLIRGAAGHDDIKGGEGNDVVDGQKGDDKLFGGSGEDVMFGGSGNDILNGGALGDYLAGETGIDTASYSGASAGVSASLWNASVNGGDAMGDRFSSIENLLGSSYADALAGASGKNTINGGSGNDILSGKGGIDLLIGGSGADTFVFDTKLSSKSNVDAIQDFNPKFDTIFLDASIFKKVGQVSPGDIVTLSKAAFWKGASAHDRSDRIIYDSKSGALYYDPDGTGAARQVKFAQLKAGLQVTNKDFLFGFGISGDAGGGSGLGGGGIIDGGGGGGGGWL